MIPILNSSHFLSIWCISITHLCFSDNNNFQITCNLYIFRTWEDNREDLGSHTDQNKTYWVPASQGTAQKLNFIRFQSAERMLNFAWTSSWVDYYKTDKHIQNKNCEDTLQPHTFSLCYPASQIAVNVDVMATAWFTTNNSPQKIPLLR